MAGRRRAAMGVLMAGIVGAGVAGAARAEEATWLGRLDRGLGAVVSPGPLARAHDGLEGVARCGDCHAGLRATPDAACGACHEEVVRRMREEVGWHGGFEGACADCHGEHRGRGADLLGLDRETFSHELARFPLRGAHREVECRGCHRRALEPDGPVRFHPLGVPFQDCAACHERDPHEARFAARGDCGVCHGEDAFTAAALRPDAPFAHDRDTAFALDGAHARVPCDGCHTPARRAEARARGGAPGRDVPRDCAGCHEDPHRGALEADCTDCHDASAFAVEAQAFDHAARTGFALDAAHAALACGVCHDDLRFRARATDCAGCHPAEEALLAGRAGGATLAPPDPHHEATVCADCHADVGPGARLADYAPACGACHPPEYAELLLTRARLVDAAALRVETAAGAAALATRRGEDEADPALLDAIRDEARALARRAAHHPGAAERRLLALLERLQAPETAR